MDAAASGGPPVTYNSLIDNYLSEAHRNDHGRGCAVGALAGEVARSDKRTRALATKLISERFEWLANSIRDTGEEDKGAARSRAIMT
jgi:TetR/AcrR family transcriptional regulator, transcriptional repressor for nem operon